MNESILVVEDNDSIAELVCDSLLSEGYTVILATDGEDALNKFNFSRNKIDLILLDLLLPKIDGLEVLRKIRLTSQIPILIVSAKDSDLDKALGLGVGADDYIAKPFSIIELIARIKAMLRRIQMYKNNDSNCNKETEMVDKVITHKNMIINENSFTVMINKKNINLTRKEFEILLLLARNPTRVYTKSQIYQQVWDDDYFGDENVINVHIRRLRKKIEVDSSQPKYIITVWGIGYKFGENQCLS